MANNQMPIGKANPFVGNIRRIDPNAFGFFYCKVTSPSNLDHPILQQRIKTVNGIRTVAGLGSWTQWLCSTEMDNAIKFGYHFEIIEGYQFEKDYIFKDFINDLYNLRLQYPKDHPMNLIAKLLMNSLYGKFGMKNEITKMEILPNKTQSDKLLISELFNLYNTDIIDFIDLGN
jgi:hypothetical protein